MLKNESAPSKHGESVAPWLQDADQLNAAFRLKIVLETRLEKAERMEGEKRLQEMQAVSPSCFQCLHAFVKQDYPVTVWFKDRKPTTANVAHGTSRLMGVG